MTAAVEGFIARWDGTAMAERANYIPFLSELCDVLELPRPEGARGSVGTYRFERGVTHHEVDGSSSSRRIDLYRKGCFVCEAKQGANPHRQTDMFESASEAEHRANVRHTKSWGRYMQAAKGQAEGYAREICQWRKGGPHFSLSATLVFASTCMRTFLVQANTMLSILIEKDSGFICRTFGSWRCGNFYGKYGSIPIR